MKLDHSASALVIVGGWNAHIFNPDWINRYLFDGKKEKLKVDILTELSHGFNPQFVLQRVSSKEVRIQLQGNKLSLNPIENKDKYFKKTEEIALLLARCVENERDQAIKLIQRQKRLPRTLISGVIRSLGFLFTAIVHSLNRICSTLSFAVSTTFSVACLNSATRAKRLSTSATIRS